MRPSLAVPSVLAAIVLSGCSGTDSTASPSSDPGPVASGVDRSTTSVTFDEAPNASPTTSVTPPPVASRCEPGLPDDWTPTVSGGDRTARFYPAAAAGPAPALVLFHGVGGTADGIVEQTRLADVARAVGVHLVAPQGDGIPTNWHLDDPAADSAFTDAIIDELAANPCVDGSRIGLAGFSAGSAWAGLYGCSRPDRVALILMASGLPANLCAPDADIDVIIAHGTADPIVAFEGGDQTIGDSTIRLDPVPDSALRWAEDAGCATERDVRPIDDGVTTLTSWTGCGQGTHVMLQVVEGMGHSWAGADADGGRLNPGCVAIHRLAGSPDAVGACL